jgi:asparagine synthase (glutamine-hydrolysing)
MAHRGPDDDGVFADADVALSARRLAVIDLSAGGHQPVRSADGRFTMVFDGEIYNYEDLADQLRSHRVQVRGTSDAEVLIEAFAAEGKDVLRQLRGMYAFAIWDARERELVCARDPFGLKPFHYMMAAGGRQLRFASERKALIPAGEVRDLDPDSLRRYLSFQYVPFPATLTPPVRSLPPGHFLVARPGSQVDVFRYWRPILRPSRSPVADTPERILNVLRESVTAHLRSDVPVGAFLSGGVDSAAVCALAAETRPGMPTFTAAFEREGYSEIEQAEEIAETLGLDNISYVITPQEFVSKLPQIIWHLDDPMADAAAVPLWFIAREARKHVKVALSGEGADELFGGNGVYYQPAAVRAATKLPGARSSAALFASRLAVGQRGKGLLQRVATPLRDRYIGNANIFFGYDVDALARHGDGTVYDVTDPIFDQAAEAELDDVATMQLVDINTWLPGDILVKTDRVTMAHGLELRSPFLDREVMATASRLARAEKTAAGTTKFALREAVGALLPQASAERQTLGFPVPLGHWFRDELAGFPEHVLRAANTDEWLDKRAVLDVARRFADEDPTVSWRQVWALVVFSLWHQIYVEGVFDPVKLGWQHSGRRSLETPRGAEEGGRLGREPSRPPREPPRPGTELRRPDSVPARPGKPGSQPGRGLPPGRPGQPPGPGPQPGPGRQGPPPGRPGGPGLQQPGRGPQDPGRGPQSPGRGPQPGRGPRPGSPPPDRQGPPPGRPGSRPQGPPPGALPRGPRPQDPPPRGPHPQGPSSPGSRPQGPPPGRQGPPPGGGPAAEPGRERPAPDARRPAIEPRRPAIEPPRPGPGQGRPGQSGEGRPRRRGAGPPPSSLPPGGPRRGGD